MVTRQLRIAVLTGQGSASTCASIMHLTQLPQVKIEGILLDTQPQTLKIRLKNLRRNIRKEGLAYVMFRIGDAVTDMLEQLVARLVPRHEVVRLLAGAFPEQTLTMEELAQRHQIPIMKVGNLNGEVARDALRKLDVDLGVVLGTRVLKRSTFSVPKTGCINLHKGKVPEYRGMPPGFWELYDQQKSAGVTVHYVDDGLDTGAIVGEETVEVHPKESPTTLRRKLDLLGTRLLARCVQGIADGTVDGKPQPASNHKTKTAPTRAQRKELESRLGLKTKGRDQRFYRVKTALYLAVFYLGLFHLVRGLRRVFGVNRACVLLYHRVNDLSDDVLTTSVERFAEHLILLRRYYRVMSSSDLVQAIKIGEPLPSNSVVIHFDDCYKDIYTEASCLLAHAGFPACAFVSSGFVGTDRIFAHDAEKYPFRIENLTEGDVIGLTKRAFEIGSHTINHVDLGRCPYDDAFREVVQSKEQLERLTGKPVTLFSYPFGGKTNIRNEVTELIKKVGYEAMFSAYGGYITRSSDLFDLRRVGASGEFRPLDLLMEIEGLSLGSVTRLY